MHMADNCMANAVNPNTKARTEAAWKPANQPKINYSYSNEIDMNNYFPRAYKSS